MNINPFITGNPQFEECGITKILKVTSIQDAVNLNIIKPDQINEISTTIDNNMTYDDEI